MATVSYKGNIILIGGINEKGQTLIGGNVIVVMGGYDHWRRQLDKWRRHIHIFVFCTINFF